MNKLTIIILSMLFLSPPLQAFATTSSLENVFYYYPNTNGYKSVERNYRDIDILAPQIYTLGFDLKLGEAESEDILKFAKRKRIDVMPLLVNANFDKILMTRFLDDEKAQRELIDALIDEAKDRNFIGWQLDFENLNHLDRDRYTNFVEMTYTAFKKKRLKLSIAVIPRTTPYDKNATTQDWSSGYDIASLSRVSDFLSLMSYDDPRSIGPVSSMMYIDKILKNTLRDVDPKKLSLGIPFYCWQYQVGNTKKIANVTYEISTNTQSKYKENGVGSFYAKEYGAEFFAFIKDDGIINYIWCDNEKSVEAKLDIVKDTGLRGISGWALGQEDPKMWKHF